MMEFDLINTGLKTLAMLFIVLGLLVSALYLMKRFMSARGKKNGDVFINVVSSLHLSPKQRVEVIEIEGERIVLGVTPGNIQFLTRLNVLKENGRDLDGMDREHETKG